MLQKQQSNNPPFLAVPQYNNIISPKKPYILIEMHLLYLFNGVHLK
jgi:hypothetical protein